MKPRSEYSYTKALRGRNFKNKLKRAHSTSTVHSSVHLGWHFGECVSLPTSYWVFTFSELSVHWGEGSGMSWVGQTSRPLASRRNVLWAPCEPCLELQALPTIYTDAPRATRLIQGRNVTGSHCISSGLTFNSTEDSSSMGRTESFKSIHSLRENRNTDTRHTNLDTLPGKRIYRNWIAPFFHWQTSELEWLTLSVTGSLARTWNIYGFQYDLSYTEQIACKIPREMRTCHVISGSSNTVECNTTFTVAD